MPRDLSHIIASIFPQRGGNQEINAEGADADRLNRLKHYRPGRVGLSRKSEEQIQRERDAEYASQEQKRDERRAIQRATFIEEVKGDLRKNCVEIDLHVEQYVEFHAERFEDIEQVEFTQQIMRWKMQHRVCAVTGTGVESVDNAVIQLCRENDEQDWNTRTSEDNAQIVYEIGE